MTDVREAAQNLIEYAIHRSMIGQDDRIWAYNTILECIGATGPALDMAWALQVEKLSLLHPNTLPDFDLEGTLAALSEAAVTNGAAEDTASGRDRIAMRIMGALMPRPSVVNEEFNGRMGVNEPAPQPTGSTACAATPATCAVPPSRATSNGAPPPTGAILRSPSTSPSLRSPRDIAAAGAAKNTGEKYPPASSASKTRAIPDAPPQPTAALHPARQNLRIIPIQLNGERWGFQYSPYAYFNEHCIAMSSEHRPMHVDRKGLTCLLDFVDLFPHYFIGSNADLPIVGGSILSHDHFQGGAHEFPMMHAAEVSQFSVPGFNQVSGTVLQWPLSVLRLPLRTTAPSCSMPPKIILAWRKWTDESVASCTHSRWRGAQHRDARHPPRRLPRQCRRRDLRGLLGASLQHHDRRASAGRVPPACRVPPYKKENIGLIEVMGLAILPPRLVPELGAVREHLLGETKADTSYDLASALEGDDLCRSHAAWAEDVYARRANELTADNAIDILHEEVGVVFSHVLDNAGVFSGTRTDAPPGSALSTHCNDPLGTEENRSFRLQDNGARPATSPTGAVLLASHWGRS